MTPAAAREAARHILAERKYRGSDVPRPLHGVLDWLARHLHFLLRAWRWTAGRLGGTDVLWTVLAVALVALAVYVALRLVRRRTGRAASAEGPGTGRESEDPRELERLADEAERRGDLEIALRLRFRAGLLRLGRAQAVPLRPSLRTLEARRALRSPRFDRLARDFDEIVYGRRAARDEDVALARAEWPRVMEEVRE